MAELIYLKNVSTLQLNVGKCTGCRMCTIVCPHGVFTMKNKRAHIIDKDACMECGACARNCEAGAISVQAGVGCAAAIINSALNRTDAKCCCSVDATDTSNS